MRVELQNINQNVDMDKITYRVPDQEKDARIAESISGYSLDITGNVTDNMAYEESSLKSVEDVKLSADVLDVTTQRNYMAVMSNSMSTEDFNEVMKEGYHPGEVSTEDMVTNLDKIKAKMAESGNVIEGYNDDLSADEMEKITGSSALSYQISQSLKEHNLPVTEDNVKEIKDALDKTAKITDITDGMVKYLINNDIEPTIDNLYKAEYSTNSYFAGKADKINWEELSDSVGKIIKEAGLDESYETENSAEKEARWMLEERLPLRVDTLSKAYEMRHMVIPKGSKESIEAMTEYIAKGFRPGQTIYGRSLEDADSEISLRRFTEETRLSMSIAANRALMRQGLQIETKNLEKAVELLKESEKELFGQAVDIIQEVAMQPADSIATAAFKYPEFTLKDLDEIGKPIKTAYDNALKSYEAVWTAPRADMGDSIKKAFRNVDDILKDLNYELNEINRKTMRILGYTQTEVTEENFERVREATRDVLEVIERMTPEKTLEMIRDGFNPLNESVSEVSKYLRQKKDSDKAESYSEYIWKLDKNNEVTESEKEAYIGIYRLIRQIEKNDGRPIGDVLNSDEELTLQNLLTAVRNRNNSGMDISIDDAFGTLESLNEKGTSITDQILQAFNKVVHTADSPETDMEYAREVRQNAAAAESVSDDVINTLLESGETLSTDNMLAMDFLMNMRGMTFRNLRKVMDNSYSEEKEKLADKLKNIKENLDSDNIDELYRDATESAAAFVNEEMYLSSDAVEVKELRLLNKQLSLASRMVRNENYEVPMEIDGRITSVNLKILRNSDDVSCRITFSTEKYGNVDARFSVFREEIKGYVLSDSENGRDMLNDRRNDFAKASGYSKFKVDYLVNERVKISDYIYSETEEHSLKELYSIAKAFLNNL